MGRIQSSLVLNDQMSRVLTHINKAMNLVINSFEAVDRASGRCFNTKNIVAARKELGVASSTLNEMEQGYRNCNAAQEKLNQSMQRGTGAANGLLGKIKAFAAAYIGAKGIGWIGESLSLFDTQNNAETQLKTVLGNTGASPGASNALKEHASELQGKTMYGDEALIGGAAEFATYMQDDKAISVMMDTLTNYAAGMSNGAEVGYQEMVDYATGLGKVMTGSYDAMSEKGFEFTDEQKKIIENGTDMEKALVISDVINESWAGLAEEMANTPMGRIAQFKNAFGDAREELAARVYPTLMKVFDTLKQHMPQICGFISGLSVPINFVLNLINGLIGIVGELGEHFASVGEKITSNWDAIAPVVSGVAAALGILAAVFIVYQTASTIAAAAQWLFNASLFGCPLVWILAIIIAVVFAIYKVVEGINKATGSTISATGVIIGALAAVGAILWNLLLGALELVLGVIERIVNPFIAIANFIGNVFRDPIGSVIKLFGDMADHILKVLQKIASAMDFVFGTSMADTIQTWRDGLSAKIETATEKYGNGKYEEVVSKLDLSVEDLGLKRIAYTDAYNAGYGAGEKFDSSIGDLFGGFGDIFEEKDEENGGMGSLSNIDENTDIIAENTGKSSEEMSYLRDIAEKEAVNRFTTAEIKVDMTGMTNRIDSSLDIDGVISYFTDSVEEALATAAEGVY